MKVRKPFLFAVLTLAGCNRSRLEVKTNGNYMTLKEFETAYQKARVPYKDFGLDASGKKKKIELQEVEKSEAALVEMRQELGLLKLEAELLELRQKHEKEESEFQETTTQYKTEEMKYKQAKQALDSQIMRAEQSIKEIKEKRLYRQDLEKEIAHTSGAMSSIQNDAHEPCIITIDDSKCNKMHPLYLQSKQKYENAEQHLTGTRAALAEVEQKYREVQEKLKGAEKKHISIRLALGKAIKKHEELLLHFKYNNKYENAIYREAKGKYKIYLDQQIETLTEKYEALSALSDSESDNESESDSESDSEEEG